MSDYQQFGKDDQRNHLVARIRDYESQHFQHSLIEQEHLAAADGEDETTEQGRVRAESFRAAAAEAHRTVVEAQNRVSVYAAALQVLDDGEKAPKGPRSAQ